ncbi:small GTP-binding domain protein [Nitzschia inconspicua]|uniref:Small GTP-binding domain protein n=1 Tax=Nitzschia inconspicua TaxID=303405 RepID=A0A9K3KXN9_9STRA|nr:small GTP-binding domain protein [Nitzschia inconspicua]
MKTSTFEIRVAVIGNVCAGKTTVLNALLGDKFSETSLKRTTAGVNLFYLVQPQEKDVSADKDCEEQLEWAVLENQQAPRSAESIHTEICADNRSLRSSNEVVEKAFTIQVTEPICEMRHDTQLVLVDIPGINEADSSLKYKKYVEANWGTFDCVIVVMDAVQGVNNQEQVDLLSLVHENTKKKNIPTIILGNKVDDPEHEAKLELVHEARAKAIEIFGDSCSEQHLAKLNDLEEACNYSESIINGAVFIPISAAYAFLYRKVGGMSSDSLKTLDQEILDGIGEQEIGPKKWARLSHQQKCDVVLEVICNPSEYEDSLKRTNFHSFLAALRFFISGQAAQRKVLSEQITHALNELSPKNVGNLSDSLQEAYTRSKAIGQDTTDLVGHFWRVYELAEKDGIKKLEEEVEPSGLHYCFVDLEKLYEISAGLGWPDQQTKTVQRMKDLLSLQLSFLHQEKEKWSFDQFWAGAAQSQIRYCQETYCSCYGVGSTSGCGGHYSVTVNGKSVSYYCGEEIPLGTWSSNCTMEWKNLSPQDWITILSSILLPSNEMEYYKEFGVEKVMAESQLFGLIEAYNLKAKGFHAYLSSSEEEYLEEARKSTMSEDAKAAIFKVEMPSNLDDPKHWGHLGYKYVCFRRSQHSQHK